MQSIQLMQALPCEVRPAQHAAGGCNVSQLQVIIPRCWSKPGCSYHCWSVPVYRRHCCSNMCRPRIQSAAADVNYRRRPWSTLTRHVTDVSRSERSAHSRADHMWHWGKSPSNSLHICQLGDRRRSAFGGEPVYHRSRKRQRDLPYRSFVVGSLLFSSFFVSVSLLLLICPGANLL
jgi:hypothetical protein